jgi:hypothetical protein
MARVLSGARPRTRLVGHSNKSSARGRDSSRDQTFRVGAGRGLPGRCSWTGASVAALPLAPAAECQYRTQTRRTTSPIADGMTTMKQLVEEVFVTEGIPQFTFVRPPNFNEILLDIRHPGKPVIVEGQSGTGKTTCVRKVLEQLAGTAPEYLTARQATDVHRIEEIARSGLTGRFVISAINQPVRSTSTIILKPRISRLKTRPCFIT